MALLHPLQYKNNQFRVLRYQEYDRELNISRVKYLIDIKKISIFEHQNNISVNICGYEDKKIFPLGIRTMIIARHHVNLLYITVDKTLHYVLVEDLNRLISIQ